MHSRGVGFGGAVFDIDGVVLDTPHEQAWRAALDGLADPARLTPALYRDQVAGRPRLQGALAILSALGLAADETSARAYCERKQAIFSDMARTQPPRPYPDALVLIADLSALGVPLAAASASVNAGALLETARFGDQPLRSVFAVDLCGRRLGEGRPDPTQYLAAAQALGEPPARCLVFDDASDGVRAAKRAGCFAVGVAREGGAARLAAAGADCVVQTLDDFDRSLIRAGPLRPSRQ